MNPVAIIAKKRDQGVLTTAEIRFMVAEFTSGTIPDYQMAAWAMAVLCRGMNEQETTDLTDAMLESGSQLTRHSARPRVDKHSTGGLGDKISLILAPLVACFDCDVPMLSGRGLGITGGTLDKLEAYPGFNCHLSQLQIAAQLERIGCVITGTTDELAPADRKLYALRDVTGTVPSIPLITASIMSKKLAATLDALVLDVKFGTGAFMRELSEARQLAHSLCVTGQRMGVATRALLTDMNQPLGQMVGNACEANEAVEVLAGAGPSDVRELTLRLSSEVLLAVGRFDSLEAANRALADALESGRAFERFESMVVSQGGQFAPQLPTAQPFELFSPDDGWLQRLDGQIIGQAVIGLGGGRKQLNDTIDPAVGLKMLVRIGEPVQRGQPLIQILARSSDAAQIARNSLLTGIDISSEPVSILPLIVES